MRRVLFLKKNRLGQSDLYVSELTLGCMSLGTNKKQARQIVDTALDYGINHLDTADLYDFGVNEEIIGEIIKDKREQIILTTKVGNHFNPHKRDWFWDPSKKYILEAVKKSLNRLQTDYIDFYMLHGGTIDDPIDETIDAFETLKREGLIRAYGISSIRPNVIREYVKRANIDAVMMQYNIFDRRPEEAILSLLESEGISVLARGPLAQGMLTMNGRNIIFEKGKQGYLDYSTDELLTIFDQLNQLNINLNELALTYILKHPAVSSVVFGASSLKQLQENIAIDLTNPMNDDLYEYIQALTKPITYQQHR